MWLIVNEDKALNGNSITKIFRERGQSNVFVEIGHTEEIVRIANFKHDCCAQELISILVKCLSSNYTDAINIEDIMDGIEDRHEEKKDPT